MPDEFIKIKKSWVGYLYNSYFRRIDAIQFLVGWTISTIRTVLVNIKLLKNRHQKRRRSLVKLRDCVQKLSLTTLEVFDPVMVVTPPPNVIPSKSKVFLVAPHKHYLFPSVYIAQIENPIVYGGSNLVFSKDVVICHDLYDFVSDYTSEELHRYHLINPKKMWLRLLRCSDLMPEKIAIAASFVDACAPNYAHWMTEILPRIASFCSVEKFRNIPLIIDDNLHPNIMESLALIVGPNREVFVLAAGSSVSVDRLFVTSVAGYTPFDRRKKINKNHSHGLFHPSALSLISERLFSISESLSAQSYPKKIYLRRASNYRKLVNEIEVEEILEKNGYSIIQPEKFTFLQQVLIFKNAEKIIGPSGSAWGNLIFASPAAKCHILIGRNELVNYWYWQNIACSTGKVVNYILGELVSSKNGVHGDYKVDLRDLCFAIS